jgi:hypothetical protein
VQKIEIGLAVGRNWTINKERSYAFHGKNVESKCGQTFIQRQGLHQLILVLWKYKDTVLIESK